MVSVDCPVCGDPLPVELRAVRVDGRLSVVVDDAADEHIAAHGEDR